MHELFYRDVDEVFIPLCFFRERGIAHVADDALVAICGDVNDSPTTDIGILGVACVIGIV